MPMSMADAMHARLELRVMIVCALRRLFDRFGFGIREPAQIHPPPLVYPFVDTLYRMER